MKRIQFFYLLLLIAFFSGCTFAGTVFVLTVKDFILYVVIAFVIAVLVTIKSQDKRRKVFWLWFLTSLLLTPIVGLVYLIYLFTKKPIDTKRNR